MRPPVGEIGGHILPRGEAADFARKGLEAYLQIPEDQELMALIALGYPDESPAAPRRKETSLLLSYR